MKPAVFSGRFSDRSTAATPLVDGKNAWIHIVPAGEFPGTVTVPKGATIPGYDGSFDQTTEIEATTVFNAQVLERLVQYFEPDILIDFEHFSHDRDKDTEAAGWGLNLRYTAAKDGLELETEWSTAGREKITGKVYRYISPEFTGDVRYADGKFCFYPDALTGAGLTNRPKLKALRPVSANRETITPTESDMKAMTLLCAILGIPATTPESELDAKVSDFQTELADLRKKAGESKANADENQSLRTEVMNRDLERFSDVIDDVEAAKSLLSLNRATAVKVFEGLQAKLGKSPESKGKEPLFQKNRATAPDGAAHFEKGEQADEKVAAHFRAVEARAHTLVKEHKIPFSQAYERAKAELN